MKETISNCFITTTAFTFPDPNEPVAPLTATQSAEAEDSSNLVIRFDKLHIPRETVVDESDSEGEYEYEDDEEYEYVDDEDA